MKPILPPYPREKSISRHLHAIFQLAASACWPRISRSFQSHPSAERYLSAGTGALNCLESGVGTGGAKRQSVALEQLSRNGWIGRKRCLFNH
ncbi:MULTISPECIES: hypothetical protein [Nitrosomonas]|uniref:hypothetical protein n=1 Tax=Nitrosomonas TaxID=914 RepID=UPI0019100312|nr:MULTISPECIES: hypothetical protein [Nitrosomonas]UVS63034.1 hypothetical protein NX761_08060 [Nitrosomonas sp. PLL12]